VTIGVKRDGAGTRMGHDPGPSADHDSVYSASNAESTAQGGTETLPRQAQ
jgi:hypothetical protein